MPKVEALLRQHILELFLSESCYTSNSLRFEVWVLLLHSCASMWVLKWKNEVSWSSGCVERCERCTKTEVIGLYFFFSQRGAVWSYTKPQKW